MGLRIINYTPATLYPVDMAAPEEIEYEVISDISGDDITDQDLWMVDGDVCSEEEMLEIFYKEHVSEVQDEDEYQQGKGWLIRVLGYKEDDFQGHPAMLKIDVPYEDSSCQYALRDDFDPVWSDCLPDTYRAVDVSDLDPEEDDDYELDYDPDRD